MAADEEVFTLPFSENINGLYLPTNQYKIVFERRIDDYKRLKSDDVLVTTYPRTGKTWKYRSSMYCNRNENSMTYKACKKTERLRINFVAFCLFFNVT